MRCSYRYKKGRTRMRRDRRIVEKTLKEKKKNQGNVGQVEKRGVCVHVCV